MNRLTLFLLDWSYINGFEFELLGIDIFDYEGSLFGIYISDDLFYISIFYKAIDIRWRNE